MTNADVIRGMDDEQLLYFLECWELGDVDYAVTFCDWCKEDDNINKSDCDRCKKNWLKSDAREWNGLMGWWNRNALLRKENA